MKAYIKRGVVIVLSLVVMISIINNIEMNVLARDNMLNEVYLSDLDWSDVTVASQEDWAYPKKDLNCENSPIRMIGYNGAAVPYQKGISLHASAVLSYDLNGEYTVFRADVGTDYRNKEKNKSTSINCYVYVDDETIPRWQNSAVITKDTILQPIEVDVRGASTLKIVVDDASNGNDSDWSVWGNARLERAIQVNLEEMGVHYLSDISWKSANTAMGHYPAKDSNINGLPLNIYGTEYTKGIGTHAGHEVVYDLKGAYKAFTALIAPDNGCNAEEGKNMSNMGLIIYADGEIIFRDEQINFHKKDFIDLKLNVDNVQELKLVTTQGLNGNDWSDDLDIADAKLYYEKAELITININGENFKEFLPSVYSYSIDAKSYTQLPVISVETSEGSEAVITQASEAENKATIDVGGKTYTLIFNTEHKVHKFDIQLPDNQLLKGTGIVHDKDIYVTVPEGMDITHITPVFETNLWTTVTVDGKVQRSGESTQDFTKPVVYQISGENGSRDYTVHVGTWRNIPGVFADETARRLERPSMVNYGGTLTMKLVLSVPKKGSTTESEISARFDDALEIIRQVDNVTSGVPKVIYLVGWQYQGHDDKYPAWGEVNKNIKCSACSHETSLDCLKWLMDEAYEKYNTKVSLHINSTDAYKDSPLWKTYVDNDLISKTIIGTLKEIGTWEGETAYQVNYKNEWEKGFYKQRVDNLIQMFDGRLERAGTIHSDAFFCRYSKQSDVGSEQKARVKMIRYWRECGIDLTTEFLHDSYENNAGGSGSGLVGLVPMVWHFNQSIQSYMERPADMITGGGINDIRYGEDAETVEILFGRSMWGEDLLTQREKYGLDHRPNWDAEFRLQFCTQTLPWMYQNTFERLTLSNNIVTYSEGLYANANTRTVSRDGKLVRDKDDVFVPVTWKDNEVIAYSVNGYENRIWKFQKEFTANEVDVFTIDKTGRTKIHSNVDVSNGSITLTLNPGQMISIVPTQN